MLSYLWLGVQLHAMYGILLGFSRGRGFVGFVVSY